ncbi:glyoxylate/hydroxypyruvate reductase A [Rhizobium sp. L1K21]|uniref:2-hydroxyacid dehydrogenase n=1 Tax=Rhizobium sp. L1K21 TaxID=2954933 RepID=UPI002092BA2E|nr:glyoxylate/hydroxypyruvate reductase A [Rhizobium sp. L1K21]MCO6187256.1 glyoxylate/hydroxypyruvate reductase A [Rhizobium sp. L1K21]
MCAALAGAFAGREVINLADAAHKTRDLSGIDYALVWKPHADLFERATDLKAVFSGGAGVDHVLNLPGLPDVPLVRFVDRSLTTRMSEWAVMQCLMHLRQMKAYDAQQRKAVWNPLSQPEAREVTVGVMGLGVLGQDAAFKLQIMGFNVIGWSRTKKELKGMETFDSGALDAFLAQTDILVGLLPLTDDTRGLFNLALFKTLRQGGALGKPVFVNAGRGGSQVEADILQALDEGILGGASLDVFEAEPLAQDSALWSHPGIFITPHTAADSDIRSLFAHVEEQIERHENGLPLEHTVNRKLGY